MLLIGIVIQTDFINASGFEVISPLRYRLTALNEAGITFYIMKTEIWLDILGYEGLYQISNSGRVKSLERMIKHKYYYRIHKVRILKTGIVNGYKRLTLVKDGTNYYKLVHRLVIESFIANPENKPQTNHKNGIKTDNKVENLEWVTRSENMIHAYKMGLQTPSKIQKLVTAKYCIENYSKAVLQLNNKGEIINEYISISEATKQTGINNISKCCLGKSKFAGNFNWKFKNQNNDK